MPTTSTSAERLALSMGRLPAAGGRGPAADRMDEHTMADLLPCLEFESDSDPDASIIVLHGLGADGHDLAPIAAGLGLADDLRVRFVFPHAPARPVSLNGGYRMRAWYDIVDADLSRRADLAGVRDSREHIERLIERERARGVSAGRIILAGFSQGGAVALYTGLRHAEQLAGIVALSAYLIEGRALGLEASVANRSTPILMCHGTEDEVVRVEWGQMSRDMLEQGGYLVEWNTFLMGHTVAAEEIAIVGQFISKTLRRAT